jgi:hypothetical protein
MSARLFVPVMLMIALVPVLSAVAIQEPPGKPVRAIEEGILDEITLYTSQAPAASSPVVMRLFSASDTDLGTGGEGGKETRQSEAKMMQDQGPKLLAASFATKLKALGPYTDITVESGTLATDDSKVIIEGTFTKIDPGSRAKRYFVGFGAGKSTIEVKGTVKTGGGRMLATFTQRRLGVMGNAGGDSLGKLKADCENIGEDLAKFFSAWGKGQSLK